MNISEKLKIIQKFEKDFKIVMFIVFKEIKEEIDL